MPFLLFFDFDTLILFLKGLMETLIISYNKSLFICTHSWHLKCFGNFGLESRMMRRREPGSLWCKCSSACYQLNEFGAGISPPWDSVSQV